MAGEATGGNGILWVCSTPLGNLEDASPRLRRVLAGADVVAAEDTRIARRLLSALGLRCRVMSCHQYNEERAAARVLGILAGGGQVALVADGGTPGVSDPGPRLVRRVLEAGHPVRPVPGPSAVTAALSVAGFAAGRFVFLGFLARKGGGRRRALDSLASLDCPAVVFESPHRVMATLRDLAEVIPGRTIALCRELTKEHEEVLRGEAVSIRSRLEERFGDDVKGEITLVVGPAEKESRRSGGNPSS